MEKHDHDRGLLHDLSVLTQHPLQRRQMLRWAFGAGVVSMVGCAEQALRVTGSGAAAGSSGGQAGRAGGAAAASCSKIPEETAGPYPGDGSNGANALALSGIVRSDIRSSIVTGNAVAAGVPLRVKLKLVDVANGCRPLVGQAVYLWHCDRSGLYSMYSPGVTDQNYLRGVQESDDDGSLTFTSIFPACYSGRWPHIHFEVYPSLAAILSAKNKLATSQLALPDAACRSVFAEAGYEDSVRNLQQVSLSSDMVFSDGVASQTPTLTGSVSEGYSVELTVPVMG